MNYISKNNKTRDKIFLIFTLLFIGFGIYQALTPRTGTNLNELVKNKIQSIKISGSNQLGMEGNTLEFNLSETDTIQRFISLLLRSRIVKEDVNTKCNWNSKIKIIYFNNNEIDLWLLRSFTSGYVFSYKESFYTNDSLALTIKRKFLDSKYD